MKAGKTKNTGFVYAVWWELTKGGWEGESYTPLSLFNMANNNQAIMCGVVRTFGPDAIKNLSTFSRVLASIDGHLDCGIMFEAIEWNSLTRYRMRADMDAYMEKDTQGGVYQPCGSSLSECSYVRCNGGISCHLLQDGGHEQ